MRDCGSEIFHQRRTGVSAGASIDTARDLVRGLELREQHRHGGSRQEARARLAGRMGVMPGTLYNLVFGRLKKFDEELRHRLTDYAIRDLEQEIEVLAHDLEVARALGAPQDQKAVRKLVSVIARAQALYDDAMRDGGVA
jgi:hypothetical protein